MYPCKIVKKSARMLNATFVDTSLAVSLLHQFCSKEFILALSKFYLSGFIGTLFFLPINIRLFVKKKITVSVPI